MSSIPQELLSGSTQRRWLQLDSPELGHLSSQQIGDRERSIDTAESARKDISAIDRERAETDPLNAD